MNIRKVRPEIILLFVTVIWGVSFVFQRIGAQHLEPFIFNACRFGLAGILTLAASAKFKNFTVSTTPEDTQKDRKSYFGYLLGILIFLGSMCQQTGLETTTAGKAGFLTTVYVVIVPFLGILFGHRLLVSEMIGAIIALYGSYLLSVTEQFTIVVGDIWELAGAFWWGLHVVLVSRIAQYANPFRFVYQQFLTCALLSLVVSLFREQVAAASIYAALPAIFYSGAISIAIGYGCQLLFQHKVSPSRAATIFTMEGVFAALSGWYFLHETVTERMILGALLVLIGVFVSQKNVQQEQIVLQA